MSGDVIFGGVAFLFPVAAYLLYLARINGRPNPTIISGPWDFVGVLFATSGSWLFGGPLMLTVFHERWRPAFLRGETIELASGGWAFLWVFPWIIYFALVLGGSALLLWRRRSYTLIYGIDAPVLEEALRSVLGRLGLAPVQVGTRILIQPASAAADPLLKEAIQTAGDGLGGLAIPAAPAVPQTKRESDKRTLAELEMDPFPTMHNVSLRWRNEGDTIRRDVEAELARLLREVDSAENPVAGWLLTASSLLLSVIFLALCVGFFLSLKGR